MNTIPAHRLRILRHRLVRDPTRPRRITTGAMLVPAILALVIAGCATGPETAGDRNITLEPSPDSTASPWWRRSARATDTHDKLVESPWAALSSQFAMDAPMHRPEVEKRVRHYIEFYRQNPNILVHSLERSAPFADFLVATLEHRKLPGEIYLIPIVESGFSPTATSPSDAAGIWQFMPATGSHFGLEQSPAYDGRRDVFDSTDAALTYLKDLHQRFGDWSLALAAYNFGQGNVARAIEANEAAGLPTDYWSLQLSRDAMAYVPKVLALRHILETHDRHGIDLPEVKPGQRAVTVAAPQPLDMRRVAGATGLELDELRQLNAAYRRGVTDPTFTGRIILPEAVVERMGSHPEQRLEQVAAAGPAATPFGGGGAPTIEVVAGDTLGSIARRHGTSVAALRQANGLTNDTIRIGQQLHVAESGTEPTTRLADASHVVQPGDSLWKIAADRGVDLGQLRRDNELPRDAIVRPGQVLRVRGGPMLASRSANEDYRIQPGDTLAGIARRYSISVEALRGMNNLDGDRIRSGEVLIVPRRS